MGAAKPEAKPFDCLRYVQHRLLVTRNLRGKCGKRGKLLLGADLKQQLQPQKFPVEIAGKAEQRRFGNRLRQLMDRRVDAEVDRCGKSPQFSCVRPAAIDAEGRYQKARLECEVCRRKTERMPAAVAVLHKAGEDVPVPQKAHGRFHLTRFQKRHFSVSFCASPMPRAPNR